MFIRNLMSYIVLIPAAVLCLFPMKNQLRYGLWRTNAAITAVFLLIAVPVAWLQTRYPLSDNAFLVWMFLIGFIAYYKSLTCSVQKALAVFSSSIALVTILYNVAVCILALICPRLGLEEEQRYIDFIHLLLTVTVTLLLARPYQKRGTVVVDHPDLPVVWNTMLLFSVVMFIVNMLLLPTLEGGIEQPERALPLLFVVILLLVIWMLIQMLFYFSVSGHLAMVKISERNQFLEAQERQFAAQQRYMTATERTRHDFRHNMRTLAELYDEGDMEAVGEFLHQYVESMPVNETVNYCRNTAVNALLNFYAHIAEQNGIAMSLLIRLPAALPVSDVDMCNMLGNILENAIVACQKTTERYIRLVIQTEEEGQLFIVVENSFDGKVRQRDGRYLSTNRNGNGMGLSSVRSTAESYGGVARFSHEGNRFYSNVAIPM